MPMVNPTIGSEPVKRGLLIAKTYYFLYFGAIGCLAPFLNIYFMQKGLTGTQIGWLGSIAPLVALIANPTWGTIADRWQIHRQVLAFCALVAGTVTLLFLWVEGFWVFVLIVTALTFFRTPIGAILDSTVMDMVERGDTSYGRQRLWGTIGFVLVSFGLGQMLISNDLTMVFWLHTAFLGVGCVILSFLLPVQSVDQPVGIKEGMGVLLRQRNYVSFLAAVTLLGMGIAGYGGFLGLQVIALGGTQQQVGLAWAVNAVLEIPLMYFGARWFAHYSYRRLILVALMLFVLEWLLVGMSATPTQFILVVLGNGICFGIFWVAIVGYASSAAPPGLSATAQAVMAAALTGLGWSMGSVISGYLWDNFSGHAIFFFAAAMALAALLIFWIGSRET
jgi:MFS family permease